MRLAALLWLLLLCDCDGGAARGPCGRTICMEPPRAGSVGRQFLHVGARGVSPGALPLQRAVRIEWVAVLVPGADG